MYYFTDGISIIMAQGLIISWVVRKKEKDHITISINSENKKNEYNIDELNLAIKKLFKKN